MKRQALPQKVLRELQQDVDFLRQNVFLGVTFQCRITGRTLAVGGWWNSIQARYVELCQGGPVIPLTQAQFDILVLAKEALQNPSRRARHQVAINNLIFHGPRRGGKSVGAFAICLMVGIAAPGRLSWVVGLRRKHGQRIITLFRKWLKPEQYVWDRRDSSITLVNHSRLEAKAQVNYDADRGDSVTFLAFDESAFMKAKVYEALAPSVADNDGFCAHFTSPAPPNWFSRLVEKSKSHDPDISEAIRTVHARPEGNVFRPQLKASLEDLKKTLSKEGYEREALGLFTSDQGRVLPGFQRETHVVKDYVASFELEGLQDATDMVARAVLGVGGKDARVPSRIKFLVGVDFNVNPSCASICKFDQRGHIWYCGEVLSQFGTEDLGVQINKALYDLGCDVPTKEALVIADASGEYQDPRGKKFAHASGILRQQGFWVFRPGVGRRNPSVLARMEITRSMCLNGADEIRLHVDAACENTVNCFLEMPLSNSGRPAKTYPGNHLYDAATYPLYRVWGTQLGREIFGFSLVATEIFER